MGGQAITYPYQGEAQRGGSNIASVAHERE